MNMACKEEQDVRKPMVFCQYSVTNLSRENELTTGIIISNQRLRLTIPMHIAVDELLTEENQMN